MRWSPSRRPAPKGMVRLVDHPDTEFRIYIVRLRFTTDDGAPIDRDEIVWPGVGFWIGRPLRPLVFEYGYLEPLNDVTLAWNCPCGRFWATRGAFEAHGCCDAPDEEQSQPVPSGAAPRVPTGLKVRSRWRLTWRTVKSEFHRGKDYTEISNWFRRLHPDHAVSARTMEDIIKAGDAGLLD